ncbi:MAG: P27 family phage terminase small subunit [Solirubrobacteraceae bacterium]
MPDPNSERSKRARRAAEKDGHEPGSVTVPGRPATIPEAPSDLGEPGQRAWDQIWNEPQITLGDRLTVERLARLEDEAANLRAEVAEHGVFLWKPIQTARGETVGEEAYESPASVGLRKLGAEQAKLCEALGLTPAGRARLGLTVVEADDRPDFLDELRARRHRRLAAMGANDRRNEG